MAAGDSGNPEPNLLDGDSALFDEIFARMEADKTEALIVARLEHDGERSPIRLGRNLPPEQAAALIALLARRLKRQAANGRIPAAFETVATVAELAGEDMASTLRQAKNLLASDRAHHGDVMGTSPTVVDGVFQHDMARRTALPANEAAIIERRKKRAERVDALRKKTEGLRETCDKALDAFRYFDGPQPDEKSQRIASLLLGLRWVANQIPPDGEKCAIEDPTDEEAAVWWALPDEERRELVDRQDNFIFRWRKNDALAITAAADEATETIIRQHPQLTRYFNPIDPAVRERDPERFDKQRAKAKANIREALLAFRNDREPDSETRTLALLQREKRLHEIWGLPPIETITRAEEARLMIPIADAAGVPISVRKGSEGANESMRKAILRGIQARETRAGNEPERRGSLFELSPKRSQEGGTRRVLSQLPSNPDTSGDDSTGATAQASRQAAAPNRSLQFPRRR